MESARPEPRGERVLRRSLQVVGGLLLFVVGAIVVLTQFANLAMRSYKIPSSAMEPTLHCAPPGPGCKASTDDRIFVPRVAPFWTPSRGDVVVFRSPPLTAEKCGEGGTFVKRLIGLPGETVSERIGRISIDGKPLREPYVRYPDTQNGTWHVAKGEYFFLGDNRAQSCDSRLWGGVPRDNLIGPVVAYYWPLDRIGSL
jgi:signal peptidase I